MNYPGNQEHTLERIWVPHLFGQVAAKCEEIRRDYIVGLATRDMTTSFPTHNMQEMEHR